MSATARATARPPSLDELEQMTDAASAAGRELAVVFQQRTGTAAAHVKRLLDSGALGRPLLAQCQTLWYRDAAYFAVPWRGKWETEGGGTTLGHGIHQLDPSRSEELVELLLKKSADPNIVAGNGVTALDVAHAGSATGIAALLERSGGRRAVDL